MIILDTNVLSAIMRSESDPQLSAWLNEQPFQSLWTTTVTLFEIRFGISLLFAGRRKRELDDVFETILQDGLEERIIPFDITAAEHAAALDARRYRVGRRMETRDTLIAGIVLAQRATLATRNVKHFADLDVQVVNPWSGN